MIYLKEGNIPLNLCTDDDISQQENNTYQLTFKYPVSDEKWSLLQNEVHLLADDLSGEQEFVIIDIQKGHGYITVYANQVATLLNGHSIRKINVDRANGFTVMNKLVEGLKRECPFTFFSDISELHTLNIENVSVIDALLKGQHSIIGQWGGDLVRDKYSVRLLKNGGIENQSLFMYKKNLSEYKESTTTKSLKTRIHFRKVITASGEGEKDKILEATVDSPLVDKYKHIYEDDMDVQDQDVKTIEDLKEYGKKYFQSSLCDLPDESLEIDVVGHADQPVKLFDTVSIFYELYNIDIRKKITSYNYSPMSKKLKKIGFGKISRSLGGAIGKIVDDVVKEKIASHDAEYEAKVQKLVDNANEEYEKRAKEIENKVTDGIEQAKAQAEVVKQEINGIVAQKILESKQLTDSEIAKANAKAEEALSKAGTFPSMESISAKLKDEILKSKDLSDKINRTFSEMDNGTEIFNKISGQVTKKLVEVEGQVNQKIGQTNQRIGQVNNELLSTNREVDQTNNRIDRTNRNLEETNRDLANINSQVAANTRQIEVQVTNYNAVRESTKMFERILGTTEEGAPNKLSRLVMSSEIFQTEVGKYVTDDNNLIVNSMTMSTNTLVGNNNPKASVSVSNGIFTIKAQGLTGYNWSGFSLPIYVKKIYHGETYTLGFKYRIREYPDSSFAFNIKNHGLNKILLSSDIGKNRPPLNEWQEFQKTFTVQEDFAFGEDANYPFYIYLAKNGWIEFKEPILVRGSNTGPYKPSQFDDAFAETKALGTRLYSKVAEVDNKTSEAKQLAIGAQARADQASGLSQTAQEKAEDAKTLARQAENSSQTAKQTALDAQQKAIQVAEQARQAQATAEATRTQVTQLAGSYAIKNLNSAGDIISGINLGADGNNRFVGKLTHITGETQIDNAVIKSAMVDKLKTGNFESGSVTTQILASNAVTADKLLVDSAMINKLVSNQAFIRELTSQKAFITELNSIKIAAERVQGGRLSANNGSTVFDLDNGTLNLFSNTGTIRRIDDTSSSQFIKFNQVGLIGEYLRDNKAARIVIGTNQDKTENTENATFAGMRLWSGAKNDVKESLYELVGDRIIFYANGQYRSPWIIHNNTKDGNSYLIPMNEKGVKHNLGRGDKHFSKAYIDDLFIGKGSQNVGGYLWDILTCFGVLARYGWDLKNGAVQNHIKSNLINKYGFK
ncbi:phage tail spike protein [Streptococcus parasanguinis]|uniref:phage tail spike protein n=1 Tax=Streptococcus parasanguinis TaxID=1318 RepID=UPI0019141AF0|nr:phage tail spike protein [Streptococcus parasanguinis]MBK5032445.1 phage tail protein [Streptococcus parasanguinis]MBK5174356.1 phage tail protein [Streptococcus parasanguinis]